VLGGTRDLWVSQTDGAAGTSNVVSLGVDGGLLFDQNISQRGGLGSVTWDGDDDPDPASVSVNNFDVDLTESGVNNALRFTIRQADVPTNVSFSVFASGGSSSVSTQRIVRGGETVTIPFVDFGDVTVFESVGAVQMTITGFPALGFEMGPLSAVPEPSAFWLLGVLGAAVALARASKNGWPLFVRSR
jgi:hypothetical protein